MIKYEVIIYWSESDQAFVAEVPELAGCAADGILNGARASATKSPGAERAVDFAHVVMQQDVGGAG